MTDTSLTPAPHERLGTYVRRRRTTLGLTQKELADRYWQSHPRTVEEAAAAYRQRQAEAELRHQAAVISRLADRREDRAGTGSRES